ncbi:MAG TPA: hypothetical protein VML35_00245 [Gaiellaceae bacterium]|nr:hypothetical protein [Gaiellaceae bacterium]
MHTGVAVTRAGEVIVGHPGEPTLLVFDSTGRLLRRAPVPELLELHEITLVEEQGEERLWLADNGTKFRVEGSEVVPIRPAGGGSVVQADLDGRVLRRLPQPDHSEYAGTRYSPTSIAVDEHRYGGSGDIWVADGYGAHLVHRFDREGRHLLTLTGEDGAGRFDCPHGLLIDRRGREPELYVTDRGNSRIQVFDLSGEFLRAFGADVLIAPTVIVRTGDELVLTDFLGARLSFLDAEDRLLGHLYANPAAPGRREWPDAWPNARDADGRIVRPTLAPEVLNSPHAIAAAGDGSLYVTEWLIGGRVTKLAPAAQRLSACRSRT